MTPSSSSRNHSPRRSTGDALAHVTQEITRFLEQGVMPWRAPWDAKRAAAATPGLPLRATGDPYRGANVILLWASQLARGYSKRTWLTYRNALTLGAHVRKGERATPVIYYGQAKSRDAPDSTSADKDTKTYRFLKLFYVFNAEQLENIPDGFAAEISPQRVEPPTLFSWLERAGASIRFGGVSAHYSPTTDTIHIPPLESFLSSEHAASTAAHEGIHWVGHESRLDTLKGYFTDRALRAREELRAELGAAIVGAMTGMAPFHLEDHAAYVADWLRLLKNDPRAFLSAGAKAQAAVDWLIDKAGHPADAQHQPSTAAPRVEAHA